MNENKDRIRRILVIPGIDHHYEPISKIAVFKEKEGIFWDEYPEITPITL